jgi:membrane carboxypeptidase/penicillin-binding protein PbpC
LRVIDPRTAYLITDILNDNYARRSTFGAGSPLQLSRPAAAKTGTTQDWRDNWTIGYTPELVVGVWAGNADNEPMRNVSGVTGAAPIWRDIMEALLKARPVREFSAPDGLAEKTVCAENGLLPVDSHQSPVVSRRISDTSIQHSTFPIPCPHTINEILIVGTEPKKVDDWHQKFALDRRNGLLAGPGCSLDFVTFRIYTRYPAEAEAWARKQGVPQPPAIYSPLCPGPASANQLLMRNQPANQPLTHNQPGLIFTSPDQGSVFRLVPNIPVDKQKIRISVRPANGLQVREVSLRINGQLLAGGPETLWQMSPGEYFFDAVALDAAGNRISAQGVTVRVVE